MLTSSRLLLAGLVMGCTPSPATASPFVVETPTPVSTPQPMASAAASASTPTPAPSASVSASWDVPKVTPEDGTADHIASDEKKARLLPRAIVKTGDLTLGRLTIAGPCYDPQRHAALLTGLVEDDGTPSMAAPDLGFDLDGDGVKDAVLEIDLAVNIRYALYVKRGKCGYFVGEVEARGALKQTRMKKNGLAVLQYQDACRRMPCDLTKVDVVFDGKAYPANP